MNLLDISHFGRSKKVGLCVKQLLAWIHGSVLWMNRPVQLDVEMIAKVTRLPTIDAQPEECLDKRASEKEIVELVKAQFGTSRGNEGIVLKDIDDNATRFANKLMDFKLLRKYRKEEAPAGVIVVAAQCVKGVMFNWAPYLLNQFLVDCRNVQDSGTKFHYSWIIILIALAGWQEPKFSAFLDRKGKCYVVRYESLWQAKDNKNQ
jgi:hypothetical protein